jgi:predicted ATP-binding protein involved in virulence
LSTTAYIRLDRLHLKNFRCFDAYELAFHEALTVLVAENGQGKTAVLDATAIALGPLVDSLADTHQYQGFDRTDIRLTRMQDGTMRANLPTTFVAEGYIAGKPVKWRRDLKKHGARSRSSTKDTEALRTTARQLLTEQGSGYVLPFVAFYGTGRLWSERRLTKGKKATGLSAKGRFSAYTDCLSSISSFRGFLVWYSQRMNEIGAPIFKEELSLSLPLITAVDEAVKTVLEPVGWDKLGWDKVQQSLTVTHSVHGELPLSVLSDGVRNMVALIGDIAYRCAILNTHLGKEAARQTPGVLLIDEVDMHLHPRWQQSVLTLLQQAFPQMQIIVTTHSPHVLSAVNAESIRVVDVTSKSATVPGIQTRGVESADVLAWVMNVNPVPRVKEAQWASDYRAYVQSGKHNSSKAMRLRKRLVKHFGPQHPVIVELETLERLQEFRRVKKLGKKNKAR